MKIFLLTGAPGAGKTTVIRQVAAALPGWRLAGFYTEEIRDAGGQRRGFRIIGFDGQEKVMAHRSFPGPLRVGKYGVDVSAIEALAEAALGLEPPADAYLVDEIGRMECLSRRFVAAMGAVLDSGRPVVATVALHGGGFIEEVKSRPGAELWEVTRGNREALPGEVVAWLKRQAPS